MLAQKVLKGETKSHENHPRLKKSKAHPHSQYAIANYLVEIWKESKRREYNFNKEKIGYTKIVEKIPITQSELRYEFDLLRDGTKKRTPSRHKDLLSVKKSNAIRFLKSRTGGAPIHFWKLFCEWGTAARACKSGTSQAAAEQGVVQPCVRIFGEAIDTPKTSMCDPN